MRCSPQRMACPGSNNVFVIDGATNSVTAVSDPNALEPSWIDVNPISNKIYVANGGFIENGGSNNVTVIDGATNSTTTIQGPQELAPFEVHVNPVTNKIYVPNALSNNVTVIDGITNSAISLNIRGGEGATTVNSVTNRIYAGGGDHFTIVAEQQVQKIPIQVAIHPLVHDRTHSAKPAFSFTAKDTFKPQVTQIDQLLFQVDTWQGSWMAAKNEGGGHFQGKVTQALQKGVHTLYAYATDGQEATSTNTGEQSSPLIGNVKAYVFLVY